MCWTEGGGGTEGFLVWNWGACVELRDFWGLKGVVQKWNWCVELSGSVWNWGVLQSLYYNRKVFQMWFISCRLDCFIFNLERLNFMASNDGYKFYKRKTFTYQQRICCTCSAAGLTWTIITFSERSFVVFSSFWPIYCSVNKRL